MIRGTLLILEILLWGFVLAGFFWQGTSMVSSFSPDTTNEFITKIKESPMANAPIAAAAFISYDILTPSVIEERVGDDGKIWFIEDLPLLGSRDFFFLFFFGVLYYFAGKLYISKTKKNKVVVGLALIALFIPYIVLSWVLLKLIMFIILAASANALNVPYDEVLTSRIAESQHVKDNVGWVPSLFLSALFGSLIIITNLRAFLEKKQ